MVPLVIHPKDMFKYRLSDLLRAKKVPYERIKGLAEGFSTPTTSDTPWPKFNRKTGPGVDGTPISHRYQ